MELEIDMARLTQELRDLIAERVGRFNTDVLVGWEAGMQGKQRIGGKLFDRHPPDYFVGPRRDEWYAGYRAGLAQHKQMASTRTVVFVGENTAGPLTIRRKGWGVRRGEVVTQMERKGCYGSVTVFYWEGSKVVRTINCGI